jgi:hypothetical protein
MSRGGSYNENAKAKTLPERLESDTKKPFYKKPFDKRENPNQIILVRAFYGFYKRIILL